MKKDLSRLPIDFAFDFLLYSFRIHVPTSDFDVLNNRFRVLIGRRIHNRFRRRFHNRSRRFHSRFRNTSPKPTLAVAVTTGRVIPPGYTRVQTSPAPVSGQCTPWHALPRRTRGKCRDVPPRRPPGRPRGALATSLQMVCSCSWQVAGTGTGRIFFNNF